MECTDALTVKDVLHLVLVGGAVIYGIGIMLQTAYYDLHFYERGGWLHNLMRRLIVRH